MRRRTTLLSAITAFALGVGGLFLVTAPSASAYTDGSFKVTCTVSHAAADDPIVLPNRPGASHLHDFFGNASTGATSTFESMQGVRSTCPSQDRSAYWTPTLYQDGRKVTPVSVTVYYVSPVTDQSTIEAFPPNFRMIAGNAKNADPAKMSGHIQWGCLGNTQIGRVVPASCPAADGIQARITFPSCWNGVWAANGGDNAPNMRYPSRNTCPAGFNRVFPTVRMNVAYLLGKTTGAVTLSSGGWPSIHADFLNVWDQPTLVGLVRKCLHGKIDCPHLKGTTPGRPPANPAVVKQVSVQPPAVKPPAVKPPAVKPPAVNRAAPGDSAAGAGPAGAGRPAGGDARRTGATRSSPAPVAGSGPAAGSVPQAAPGAVGAGLEPGIGVAAAPPDAGAVADGTAADSAVLGAGEQVGGGDSAGRDRWHLVSEDGTVNAPVAAGAGLLVAALLMSCALLVRGARRRSATPAPGRYPS